MRNSVNPFAVFN